jgi:hypothetical protein
MLELQLVYYKPIEVWPKPDNFGSENCLQVEEIRD